MNIRNASTLQWVGVALGGTLVAGGLLALAVPTHMIQPAGDWRDTVGIRKVATDDAAIPIYAPPEDLTPVHWQNAAEEYPSAPTQDQWSDVPADLRPDLPDDASADLAADTLPPEMIQASASETGPAAIDDTAASSAEAARAAAADVRAQENAVTEPTVAAASSAPQAASGTT